MKNILICLIIFIFTCCSSVPTKENCNSIALNLIYQNKSLDYLSVISVEQVNTIEGIDPKNGCSYYDVQTKLVIQIIKECVYYPKLGFRIILLENNYFEHDISQIGSKYSFEKVFRFYKTGNGWLGEDGFTY